MLKLNTYRLCILRASSNRSAAEGGLRQWGEDDGSCFVLTVLICLTVKIDEHCYQHILLSFINCDENLVLDL